MRLIAADGVRNVSSEADRYLPVNSPAIGDLLPLFTFSHP
jgi:hypothetical protein